MSAKLQEVLPAVWQSQDQAALAPCSRCLLGALRMRAFSIFTAFSPPGQGVHCVLLGSMCTSASRSHVCLIALLWGPRAAVKYSHAIQWCCQHSEGCRLCKLPAGVLEVVALLALLTFRRLTGTDGLALARLVEDEESSCAVLDPRMQHSSTLAARHWTPVERQCIAISCISCSAYIPVCCPTFSAGEACTMSPQSARPGRQPSLLYG